MFVCHSLFDLGKGPIDRHTQVLDAINQGATCILAALSRRPLLERLLAGRARDAAVAAGDAADAEEGGRSEEELAERRAERRAAAAAEAAADEEERARRPPGVASDGLSDSAPGVRVLSGFPVIFVDSVDDMGAKLATAFYGVSGSV